MPNEKTNTVNTYGVPQNQFPPKVLASLDNLRYEHYDAHPDKMSWVDWTKNGEDLKKSIENGFYQMNYRYIMRRLQLDADAMDNQLVEMINSSKDYTNFQEAMQGKDLKNYFNGENAEKFAKHFGVIYYTVKKDLENKKTVDKFIEEKTAGMSDEYVAALMGRREKNFAIAAADNAANEKKLQDKEKRQLENAVIAKNMEVNCGAFAEYRKVFAKCYREMDKTESAWGSTDAYHKMHRKMQELYMSLQSLSVNDSAEELRAHVDKFVEGMDAVNKACDAYVNKHMPDPEKGETLSSIKLTRMQMKRLGIISEFKQLYNLYNNNPGENPYNFSRDRNPATADFSKKRAALKMMNQLARKTVELKTGTETVKNNIRNEKYCRRLLFNDGGCGDYEVSRMVTNTNSSFNRMHDKMLAAHVRKEGNSVESRMDFYQSFEDMSGSELVDNCSKAKVTKPEINAPQIQGPGLH